MFSLYALAILFFRKFEFIKLNEKDNKSDIFINKLLNTLVVLFFIAISTTSLYVFFVSESKIIISKNTLFNIDGFGYSGLLSLIILPLCFQFVDLSNWQRLLSVKDDNKNSINIVNNKIRKGLLNYALESPFTWLIFVFFGILVVTSLPHFTFQDLLIDIPKNLIKSDLLIEKILGYSFIVSILAIMLSTIDSFLMGIIFTYTYDSNPKTRKILDSKDNQLIIKNNNLIIKKGRIFGFILISVGLLFFILLDKNIKNGGELFINLLLSFYSAQISFFPLVFSILFLKKRPSAFWAISSMIVSSLIGISVGIYAVIINPEWAWFPILLCFVISNLIFFTGYFLTKNKNKYNEI